MWALGNICGDGPQMRGVVLKAGIFHPLMQILESQQQMAVSQVTAAWVLSHLCKGCSARDEVSTGCDQKLVAGACIWTLYQFRLL